MEIEGWWGQRFRVDRKKGGSLRDGVGAEGTWMRGTSGLRSAGLLTSKETDRLVIRSG